MKTQILRRAWLCALLLGLCPIVAHAHALPTSYLDVKIEAQGADATFEASAKDFVRELPALDAATLLTPQGARFHGAQLAKWLDSRLEFEGDGRALRASLRAIEAVPERGDLRLHLRYAWNGGEPKTLGVRCLPFARDREHKTFLTLYRGATLVRQDIFDANTPQLRVALGAAPGAASAEPGAWAVIQRFVREGIHHIFIGPDHILFIVGLLLLGGNIKSLLKIVTAFTLAHSLTLVLATLGILNPPARLIEPLIALSIVWVGVHDLRQLRARSRAQPQIAPAPPAPATQSAPVMRGGPDARLLFAFGFGLVHGFGFAGVLRELELPANALLWSLGAFNIGVEIGQMCIVLAVAPLLAGLGRLSRPLERRVAWAGAVGVVAAGAFWFVQRVAFA